MPKSISINFEELENLKNYILKTGLKRVPITNQYELLRINDGDINLVVYKTGKVVHNDTEASRRVIDVIIEKKYEYEYVLGSDEVGKGEWYGPLVVVCVALTPSNIAKFRKIGVRDSKLLGKSELRKLANGILSENIVWKEVRLEPEKYNELYKEFQKENKGLNDLLAWAHAAAINDTLGYLAPRNVKVKIIIDKFDAKKMDLRLEQFRIIGSTYEIIQSSKGDMEIPVSVASILAKDIFEKRVSGLNKQFNINLPNTKPEEVNPKILPYIAKTHFKNIKRLL